MSEDKPLHVRVAEALGWTPLPADNPLRVQVGYTHIAPNGDPTFPSKYDTDWSATGPLIEKYGIALDCEPLEENKYKWRAEESRWKQGAMEFGPTPLIAVCNLILALKEAGKL